MQLTVRCWHYQSSNLTLISECLFFFYYREADMTKERIEKLLKAGANVILTTKGIDDMALKVQFSSLFTTILLDSLHWFLLFPLLIDIM